MKATDIQAITAQMTLEEKAALCIGTSSWTTKSIKRLIIPEMIVSDGPYGVRRLPDVHSVGTKSLPVTCFPTASCLASTWNVDLIYQMDVALAVCSVQLMTDEIERLEELYRPHFVIAHS